MRNYGQFCPIARGSEVLAERWTPIILRNILLGCRTFNEIAAGAPGLSRALLTRRLRELERAGVIGIRPKPDGHGSLYEPTAAGRGLWAVLQALGDWAQQWMDVTSEHADPDAVLWSWTQSFLRRDLLPDRRLVVRFAYEHRERPTNLWLLIERRSGELCSFDPGFGDDLVVTINDPLVFARWHLGLVEWAAALRCGAVAVRAPEELRRALPTWNAGPAVHARKRAEHARTPAATPPLPLEAVAGRQHPVRPPETHRAQRPAIPGFEGQLITPDDDCYDDVRAVWNGAVDRRPRFVARCLSPSDVAAALRFGRDRGLAITVRGGGHGVAGNAVCDDGLVLDLGPMKRIEVDPARRVATAQGGVLWGELDTASQAFGLATTGGMVAHTGIAGLTLGGGMGWLMRRHGLTVDNLLAAEVVTVDGNRLSVSEEHHPDVFWGLRGGGGLGVVTSFTYRLHPVGPEVLAGPVLWALEDAPAVLRAYRRFISSAPPEVATLVTLRRAPAAQDLPLELHGRPVCSLSMLALADPDRAERLLARMRSFGSPLVDLVTYRPYVGLQSMIDTFVPHGWHYYWKSAGLRQLDDTVIDTLVDQASRAHSPWSHALIFHLGGAVAEADPQATAYSRRDILHELNVNAVWLPGEPIGDAETAWAKGFIAALGPRTTGAYLNFLDHDDHHRIPTAFTPAAYDRLRRVQRRLDPDHVLRRHSEGRGSAHAPSDAPRA